MSHPDKQASAPQDENHIIAERRQKLAEWRQDGRAYPNDFRRENTAGRLHELYDGKTAEELESLPVQVS
ncbi:MAG: lysine--tRNA ligase, partial [Zoogloeaceae bacterium]|nr:lysine--tRNA ligase [Zoogloeaceae bacterium]